MLPYLLMGREKSLSYTVHEPPQRPADRVARAEALEFVRDGFSWQAFFFAPAWLFERKIWTGLLVYTVAIATLGAAWWIFELSWPVLALVLLAIHALIASEADEMLRAQMTARGWELIGQVTGSSALDCERRFFDTWLDKVPMSAPQTTKAGTAAGATSPAQPQALRAEPPVVRTVGILGSLLAPRHRDKS